MTVSGALVVVAVVVAVNPARLVSAAGSAPAVGDVRRAVTAGSAGLVVGVGGLAVAGGALWRWLDVSAPTGVLAAGLVLVLGGAWAALVRPPRWEPALEGWRGALVPVLVPLGLRPEVGLVALAAGADGHAPAAVIGAVAAAAVGVVGAVGPVGATAVGSTVAGRVLGGAARGTGAVAVAVGIAWAVAGVYSV